MMFDRRAQLMALQNMRRGAAPASGSLAGAMAPVMGTPPPAPMPQQGGLGGAVAPVMGAMPAPQQPPPSGLYDAFVSTMGQYPQRGGQPAMRGAQRPRRPMGGGY